MKLSKIFKDGMIIQANEEINIYGSGKGNISIKFKDQFVSKEINEENWLVVLNSEPYGGPYEMEISLDGEDIILKDIYLGDVYLMAGQSNMQFKVKEEADYQNDIKFNDLIRFFDSGTMEEQEVFSLDDGWIKANTIYNIENMCCIGYHIATNLSNKTNHAIGILEAYQGASCIESWLPKEKISNKFEYKDLHIDHIDPLYQRWNKDGGILYENYFKKLTPYRIKGVVWYQGESNTTLNDAVIYKDYLIELVSTWRHDFRNENLPFVIVQIADFKDRDDDGWKAIQDIQENIVNFILNTYSVKAKEYSENIQIHPSNKRDLSFKIASILDNLNR